MDLFGLDDGLLYSQVTIEQGIGDYSSDTIIKYGDEYLVRVVGVTVSLIDYYDFVSMSMEAVTLMGGSGDDVLIGVSGSDTLSSGSGDDVILAYGGDDAITIDGAGDKFIDGGTGSNSLTISYLNSVDDFSSISYDPAESELSFITSGGDIITTKSINTLMVGETSYDLLVGNGSTVSSPTNSYTIQAAGSDANRDIGYDGVLFDSANNEVFLFDPGTGETNLKVTFLGHVNSYYPGHGLSTSSSLTINGSTINDVVDALGFSNAVSSSLGAGDDLILLPTGQSSTVSTGSGNDIVFINTNGSVITEAGVDGGDGVDTLGFGFDAGGNAITFTLNSGVVSNFENVVGSIYDDNLTGDVEGNILFGGSGTDVLYGLSGNDYIYGDNGGDALSNLSSSLSAGQTSQDDDYGDDSLYGGEGNDIMSGDKGDDLLDGGAGADTISTGVGVDTIVLRAGDGGASISEADTVTDFTDGMDLFGLDDGLQYSDLTVEQGVGDHTNDTVIKFGAEYLAIVKGVSVAVFAEVDFEPVNISQ